MLSSPNPRSARTPDGGRALPERRVERRSGHGLRAALRGIKPPRIGAGFLLGLALWSAAAGAEIVDRIVAVVDRDAITLSEAERARKLRLLKAGGAPLSLAETVERLVELRLVAREVERYPAQPVAPDEVAAAVESVRAAFDSETRFRSALAEAEMTEAELASQLRAQLAVDHYLERRFRSLIQLSDEEIRSYYQEELRPALGEGRAPPPSLESVSPAIRRILEERQFNSQVAAWIDQLKARANVRRYVW